MARLTPATALCALLWATAIAALWSAAALADEPAERAKVLYEAGINLMKAEEYVQAAEVFDKASALVPDPVLLWNAARSYDAAGVIRPAIERYKAFMLARDTEPDFRALALERIVALEAAAASSGGASPGRAAPAPAVAARANPAGIDWVPMPAGSFAMGCEGWDRDEKPVHHVTLDAFEIGRTETTVAQYAACVAAGACTEPVKTNSTFEANNWGAAGRDDYPVNGVEWQQAASFCEFAGGRLPTEAEWEYAARSRGQTGNYPWGDRPPSCEVAVMKKPFGGPGCGDRLTSPVCSRPGGHTAEGLCDTLGNVWEWVADIHDPQMYKKPPGSKVFGRKHVLRGGSFEEDSTELRACNRGPDKRRSRHEAAGFRCAR